MPHVKVHVAKQIPVNFAHGQSNKRPCPGQPCAFEITSISKATGGVDKVPEDVTKTKKRRSEDEEEEVGGGGGAMSLT